MRKIRLGEYNVHAKHCKASKEQRQDSNLVLCYASILIFRIV